jgi:predicted nucleotidyltransferase
MQAEDVLAEKEQGLKALCREYAVTRLRLFGSALREDWDPATSDFDFLVEFDRSKGLNAFDQLMGFTLLLEELLGHKVDIVDWNAAKNPHFRRNAESLAKEVYAA